MSVAINSEALKRFFQLHRDDKGRPFSNVEVAVVEFDFSEFKVRKELLTDELRSYYEMLRKLEGIRIRFIGDSQEPVNTFGLTGVKPSSNVEVLTEILNFLGRSDKHTIIIAGAGCDAPHIWTFREAVESILAGGTLRRVAETWAKRIIESPVTTTVEALSKIVNQYKNFILLTRNITRSFEAAHIELDRFVRMVDNDVSWMDEEEGIVRAKLAGKLTKESENIDIYMKDKPPEALIYLGYGFNTVERMYLNNYPNAILLVVDKSDKQIIELKVRANDKTGTGYLRMVDDLVSVFLPMHI